MATESMGPTGERQTVEARVSIDQLVPNLPVRLMFFGAGIALMSFIAGIGFASGSSTTRWVQVLEPLLIVAIYLSVFGALVSRRIRVARGELTLTGFMARTRRLPAGEVQGIFVTWATLRTGMSPYIFFIGTNNRCVLRLYQKAWRMDDIEAIGRALGVPVEVTHRAGIPAQELVAQFPGSFSTTELHSGTVFLVVIGVVLAAGAFALFQLAGMAHLH